MFRINNIWYILCAISVFCSCKSDAIETNSTKATNQEINDGVSIELSMPYGDSLKWLGICWDKNPVDVIIRNHSDSMIYFYEDWNSWGFYNFKFQIVTNDSIYLISRTNNVWWKNFPTIHSINPDQSLVFHFDLTDSSCFEHNAAVERINGLKQWSGLPQKEYESAKISVIYELPDEYKFLINNGFRKLSPDSVKKDNDTTFIFSQKLVSEPVNIKIIK